MDGFMRALVSVWTDSGFAALTLSLIHISGWNILNNGLSVRSGAIALLIIICPVSYTHLGPHQYGAGMEKPFFRSECIYGSAAVHR